MAENPALDPLDGPDEDELFQLAGHAARRIVTQCRAHVLRVNAKMADYTENAADYTPYAQDAAAAQARRHVPAHAQRVHYAEACANAMASHLQALEVLMKHDTFHALSATVIVRAIAEVSATTAWMLDPKLTPDERAARGYASLFRSIENAIKHAPDDDVTTHTELRERLVHFLNSRGVTVERKRRGDVVFDEVAQITVGAARARPNFQYSRRIEEEIPSIGGFYSALSGIAHGEQSHVVSAWASPATRLRVIGLVVDESVKAWSHAFLGWIGVDVPVFVNPRDIDALRLSLGPERIARFEERKGRATSGSAG